MWVLWFQEEKSVCWNLFLWEWVEICGGTRRDSKRDSWNRSKRFIEWIQYRNGRAVYRARWIRDFKSPRWIKWGESLGLKKNNGAEVHTQWVTINIIENRGESLGFLMFKSIIFWVVSKSTGDEWQTVTKNKSFLSEKDTKGLTLCLNMEFN